MVAALTAAMLALAGCGDDGGGGGGRAPSRARPRTPRRRPRSTPSKGAKGKITMCAGKDTSGALTEAIKRFNKPHAADG